MRWRAKLLLLGSAAALAAALPALSQVTEPVLPPGFGDPEPAEQAPPEEAPVTEPAPVAGEEPPPPPRPGTRSTGGESLIQETSPDDLAAIEALTPPPPPIEIPDEARRPIDFVGVLDESAGGLGADAFGAADGRFLSTLMRRLDAPIASRWQSMLLRRALLTRVPAPVGVHPVDWVAERAWLLLRMGEADAARMLVQSIDVDQFTPKMFAIAVQSALATADPAGLCPLVGPGRETSDEPVWPLAEAMCASLSGEPGKASSLIDQARRRSRADPIDLDLAEKVIGAGANTRRAVTIEWDDVDQINSWRFGLAAATGLEIPAGLMSRAGSHVLAWQARAPMLPLEQRLSAIQAAASLGVFGSASLVDIYSQIADETDPSEINESVGGRLRTAYAARKVDQRMRALRSLWGEPGNDPVARHARLILTATAATALPAIPELAPDAPRLIASMLSAGYDAQAAEWSEVVGNMEGEDAGRAWAMLALASPRPAVEISAGRIGTFQDSDDTPEDHATKLLIAALAGLGRIDADTATDLAEDHGIRLGAENRWTRLLARAAERGQNGTVALLAGAGMQTGAWRGVPPEHLYHITRALSRVGMEYEARMIAAEAIARL
ncbi:MAG TPA: hypothetical protein VF631_12045 [Allosphingosinicella sp.]|jgi:hypothetical protein|uniref:hypothetical protein n=1 Tax=Allosphingosinicella sp. TaxID=2823234 RepID=UPI002F297BBC